MIKSTTTGDSKWRWFVSLLSVFIISIVGMGVLWVTSLPKLTLEQGKVTITNCELPLPTYAIGVCPKLYCKKEILESGLFPQDSQVGFSNPKPSADQVLTGAIRYYEQGNVDFTTKDFECELDGYEVKGLSYL